jgi:flagellar FliL protein
MAANRVESPTDKEAGGQATAETPSGEASANGAAAPAWGGFMAWLPLILAIVLMPVLAFLTTKFILLPKMQHAAPEGESAPTGEHGSAPPKAPSGGKPAKGGPSKSGKEQGPNKPKTMVPMSKVLVNVSGSMGTRYLLANMTLVGTSADFKDKIESNRDQLVDLAAGVLGSKTINDLEKPGARNMIRTEIISVFNNALGEGTVQEIYMTEFAIQ